MQISQLPWYVWAGAPVVVALFVLQLVLKGRSSVKKVRQFTRSGTIVTAPDGPTGGQAAQDLACGAHMAVNQGVAWNDVTGRDLARTSLRVDIQRDWGVAGPRDWQDVMDRLLAERGDSPADAALALRRGADLDTWTDAIRQAGGAGETGVQELLAWAQRITRYEEKFRADGLLPPGAWIRSVRAYDWGRAVNMARWGLRAGYCDRPAAERAVRAAGDLCARHHTSWADLSAAYGLGRLLRFDDDEFGVWYDTVAEPHKLLTTDPDSPWHTLPWPATAVRP